MCYCTFYVYSILSSALFTTDNLIADICECWCIILIFEMTNYVSGGTLNSAKLLTLVLYIHCPQKVGHPTDGDNFVKT